MSNGVRDLRPFVALSLVAAVTTLGLKLGAWAITGSVGLLSDALESSVNLVAAILLALAVHIASRPADESHPYGHEKAELFSAAAEGLMIVVAAALIVWTAVDRLLHPQAVQQIGLGLAVSVVAALVNLGAALVLLRGGRAHDSLALTADGRHLLTDVWTSAGVVVGVGLVAVTGWDTLDPLVALAVGVNIVVTGTRLLWRAGNGLLDPPLPPREMEAVREVLAGFEAEGVVFHALRTRTAGHRRFLSVHVLVPGDWSVRRGHDLVEEVEGALRARVGGLHVFTHLEPVEDSVSYADQGLDR